MTAVARPPDQERGWHPATAPGPSPPERAGVTSPHSVHRPRTLARPGRRAEATGSRAPRRPGPAQPMGWRRPQDPRGRAGGREGVGRQAGRARRRALSPPPPPPGREVSCPGPQCERAGERDPQEPARGTKHGGRQGKASAGGPGARGSDRRGGATARARTCRVDAAGDALGRARRAAGPPGSGGRRELPATPGRHRRPVRAPRPDLAAGTLQGTLPLGRGAEPVPDRRPAGSAKAGEEKPVLPGRGRAWGQQVLWATPALSCPWSRCWGTWASPSRGRSARG